MSNVFNEFVLQYDDGKWEGDILALGDEHKDEAVYLWLKAHKTWLDDIFPATFTQPVAWLTAKMIWGEKKPCNDLVARMFKALAEDTPVPFDRDDLWWSNAMDMHLDTIIECKNFVEDFKEGVYLYLEETLRDEIKFAYDKQITWGFAHG